ncbi:related to SGT1 - subunit of SCF ubiquitin ligase complex [Ustilago trichophora]|uniref:Related to SGT1 - subunit of SCF ubiquitin ligase complex n=1 Tax=Ustilago trichophora TaxID=86804 RepID=A0A5C3DUU7_9BASI|nr:related to SGT1 - subunit of SCF ubiquitin ligase complex [Ustilago trichophora]
MATASTSTAAATPKFDFYQTDTALTLSVFIKSADPSNLSVDIGEQSLSVKATSSSTGSEYVLSIDPLFSTVDPTSSSYKVLSTKIDVILHKAQPGLRWAQLHAGASSHSVISAATPSYAAANPPASTAPRSRSKWDSFNPDEDDDNTTSATAAPAPVGEKGADGGEADINKFFQKLYADADDDTKRAMMKSYQESGGTSLSTDWSKVGKEQTKITPPDGMEAKQW